jgi:cellulose synthase/poly-beta-1,6-N-acetylglucosamine synthase-like glycosyltransferase
MPASTNKRITTEATMDAPVLSVVIPVYNSRDDLALCLKALTESDYVRFDVLIVDDGSQMPIKPLADEYGVGYLRIDGPGGPARARNRGVESVLGQYAVFIDADVCVHPQTLTHIALAFAKDPLIDAVIGSYDDAPADLGFISQYKNLFHHYVHQNSHGQVPTFWSGCGAIKRDLFLSFGGFDEKRYRRPAIEDIELGTWITLAGYRIVLDPNIKAKHLKRWTIWNLLKTDIDRGIPWTRLMLRAGKFVGTLNVTPAQRLSVTLVYLAVIALLSAIAWPKTLIAAAALALAVTLLNLDFYRFYRRRKGLSFALRVVPMHWLYFLYCGVSAIGGTLMYLLEGDREKTAKPAEHHNIT